MNREKKVRVDAEKAALRIALHKIRERMDDGIYSQESKDLIFDALYPLFNCCFRLLDWIEAIEGEAY